MLSELFELVNCTQFIVKIKKEDVFVLYQVCILTVKPLLKYLLKNLLGLLTLALTNMSTSLDQDVLYLTV